MISAYVHPYSNILNMETDCRLIMPDIDDAGATRMPGSSSEMPPLWQTDTGLLSAWSTHGIPCLPIWPTASGSQRL